MENPPAKPPRLPLHVCLHLERLVGGDARTENLVRAFILKHWKVDCITRLPLPVAYEIMRRPADFLANARELSEPSLKL